MELVKVLRELWRLRVLVGCALLVAVLAGVVVAYRISSLPPRLESRRYDVGVATARILVDTPSSQVVEVAPKGSDTLGVRANLLASLMVDGVVKTAIARRSGLRDDQLEGVSGDEVPDPTIGRRANVLTTRVLTNTGGEELPIIEIEAQSPTVTGAARLANAAIAGLRDYLDAQAAAQNVGDNKRLRISGLGGAQARQEVRGPKPVLGIAAIIFVFLALIGLLLGALAMVRAWRAADAEDLEGHEPAPEERDDATATRTRDRAAAWARGARGSRGAQGASSSVERASGPRPRPTLASRETADESHSLSDDEPRANSAWR
jgi:hypothetical protein